MQSDNISQCPICFNEITTNKLQLECSHIFHKICIEPWIAIHNNCPICRAQVTYQSCNILPLKSFNSPITRFNTHRGNFIYSTHSKLIIKSNNYQFDVLASDLFSIHTNYAVAVRNNIIEIYTQDNTYQVQIQSQIQHNEELIQLNVKKLHLQLTDFYAATAADLFLISTQGKIIQTQNLSHPILQLSLPYILTTKSFLHHNNSHFTFLFISKNYIDFDFHGENFVFLAQNKEISFFTNKTQIFTRHLQTAKNVYLGAENFCVHTTDGKLLVFNLENALVSQFSAGCVVKDKEVLFFSEGNEIYRILI